MRKTTRGTAHFVSINAAILYYRQFGIPPMDVRDKLRDGEISIGKPPLVKPTDKVVLLDGGLRYGIESEDK